MLPLLGVFAFQTVTKISDRQCARPATTGQSPSKWTGAAAWAILPLARDRGVRVLPYRAEALAECGAVAMSELMLHSMGRRHAESDFRNAGNHG